MVLTKEDFYIITDKRGVSYIYPSDELYSPTFKFNGVNSETARIPWWMPKFSMRGEEMITGLEDVSCEVIDEVLFAEGLHIYYSLSQHDNAPMKDYYVFYGNHDLSNDSADYFIKVHELTIKVSPFRYDGQTKQIYLRTKIHIQIRLYERPMNKYIEEGVVKDQDGNPVPNALVTALDTLTLHTDAEGRYRFSIESHDKGFGGSFIVTAKGYTTYFNDISPYFFDDEKLYSRTREVTIYNALNLKAGQRQTIILPVTPDTSLGRYFRLKGHKDKRIIFEREFNPKACIPYILVPSHDARLDLSDMNLSQGSFFRDYEELGPCRFEGSFNTTSTVFLRSETCYQIDTDFTRTSTGHIEAMHGTLIYPRDWYPSAQLVLVDPEGDFRPFIEEGKRWKVGHYRVSETEPFRYSEYYFDGDTVVAGRTCKRWMERSYMTDGNQEIITELGALYEENRKVWKFPPQSKEPQLLYDFSAEEGDELTLNGTKEVHVKDVRWIPYHGKQFYCITLQNKAHNPNEFGPSKNVWIDGIGNCKSPLDNYYEAKVGTSYQLLSCTVGNEVIYDCADNPLTCLADYRDDAYYRPIIEEGKQWVVGVWGDGQYDYRKIYSISAPEEFRNYTSYGLVCSTQAKGDKYPKYTLLGYLHEKDRKVWFISMGQEDYRLVYDFSARSGDTITIQGITENFIKDQALTTPIQYMGTEVHDPQHSKPLKKYRLTSPSLEEGKGGEWIAGIGGITSPVCNFRLTNNSSKEILISCQTGSDTLYYDALEAERMASSIEEPASYSRPFIEEGKVWKVGWTPPVANAYTAKRLDYYYFEGDTIIDDKICKKMLCRHEASEEYPFDYGTKPWTEYIAAIYEEGKRVYGALPDDDKLYPIYDFDTAIGDTIQIRIGVASSTYKFVSGIVYRKCPNFDDYIFKGNTVSVRISRPDDKNRSLYQTWWEGVGYDHMPLDNVDLGDNSRYRLMTCTVGDEVLYFHPYMVDGVTPPDDPDVKKHQLDFTHVVKPRPKAPAANSQYVEASSEEETVTGEYSIKELFVNFKTLAGPYTVTLTDVNDKEVYRKTIETSNTVGLATDLARYGNGTYTLTIENDEEQYIATLNIDDKTGIENVNVNGNESFLNHNYYDLSGRRVSVSSMLPRGVYIKDGKKVVVK